MAENKDTDKERGKGRDKRDDRGRDKRDDRGRRKSRQEFWEEELKRITSKETVQKLIREGGRLLVGQAEKLGENFRRGDLTTSQIRNIYGMVKKMEMDGFNANKFVLFKPKLAYAAARADRKGAYQFKEVMTWAIDEVDRDDRKFVNFVDFFEAILAYHKAAGGK